MLLALSLMFALPESPYFLARRPRRRAELQRLLERSGCSVAPDAELVAEASRTTRTPLSALFGVDVRVDTLLVWSSFFLTMLALYTLVSWAPTMLASEGYALAFTGTALAAFGLGGIIGCLCSGFMLANFGSRPTQIVLAGGGALVALGFAALFTAGQPATLTVMLVFGALGFSSAGMQNSLYTLAAHLYATSVRAMGIGAALSVGRLGAVASAFTGALSLDLGGGVLFFVFVAVGLALAAVTAACVGNPLPTATSNLESSLTPTAP